MDDAPASLQDPVSCHRCLLGVWHVQGQPGRCTKHAAGCLCVLSSGGDLIQAPRTTAPPGNPGPPPPRRNLVGALYTWHWCVHSLWALIIGSEAGARGNTQRLSACGLQHFCLCVGLAFIFPPQAPSLCLGSEGSKDLLEPGPELE